MSFLSKGMQLSVFIHAVAFGLIIAQSMIFPAKSPIITIDFSLSDSCIKRDTSQKTLPLAARAEKKKAACAKMVENRPVEDSPKPQIPQEKETVEAPALPPAISEHQAPTAERDWKTTEEMNSSKDTRERGGSVASAQTYGGHFPGSSESGDERKETAYIKESFSHIRDSVRKNVFYPRLARKMGWEGKVILTFTILSNGNVKEIKVVEGCGIDMLNESAIEAVKKASPFPRPPVEAQIVLPIVYRLN